MDDEHAELEDLVSTLEDKIDGLDEDSVKLEELARLRAEVDDVYERIDASDLPDEVVNDLMERLDDLQDILDDLGEQDEDWQEEDEEGEDEEAEDSDE